MIPSRARAWRVVALTSLTVGANACTSLRVLPERVPEPLPAKSRDEVRLILLDGQAIYLKDAQIVGDSIVGLNIKAKTVEEQRYAVHKADVSEVAVRRGDAFKTVLAVAGGLLAIGTFALLAACASLASGY
jgi:hypothetical protein